MGVGADQRVREGDRLRAELPGADDRGQVLEVDLVDDAGARRHDAEVLERLLRPAQQRVALAVALVLQLDVAGEGEHRAEAIDLNRVVDDEIGRHQRVDPGDVAAEPGDGRAHRGQIDDARHTGEVLQHHPARQERQLELLAGWPAGVQAASVVDVALVDELAAGVAQHVFEQDADRERQPVEIGQPLLGQRGRAGSR